MFSSQETPPGEFPRAGQNNTKPVYFRREVIPWKTRPKPRHNRPRFISRLCHRDNPESGRVVKSPPVTGFNAVPLLAEPPPGAARVDTGVTPVFGMPGVPTPGVPTPGVPGVTDGIGVPGVPGTPGVEGVPSTVGWRVAVGPVAVTVGVAVGPVGVTVGVKVGVAVGPVGVTVGVSVSVGVAVGPVGVMVGVSVRVGVAVGPVGVMVGVSVRVGVAVGPVGVMVGVSVSVGVAVGPVGVTVGVSVKVGVAVGVSVGGTHTSGPEDRENSRSGAPDGQLIFTVWAPLLVTRKDFVVLPFTLSIPVPAPLSRSHTKETALLPGLVTVHWI